MAGPGATPSMRVSPASRTARIPSHTAALRVADAVGVVQQQQIEALDAAALEAALGGHADVVAVLAGLAQRAGR